MLINVVSGADPAHRPAWSRRPAHLFTLVALGVGRTGAWISSRFASVRRFASLMLTAAKPAGLQATPSSAPAPAPRATVPAPEPSPDAAPHPAGGLPSPEPEGRPYADELAAANDALRQYQRALAESKGLATLGRLVDASTHETNNRLGTAILAI